MSKHTKISYWKSGLRYVACIFLFSVSPLAAFFLALAELLGIWEEVGL